MIKESPDRRGAHTGVIGCYYFVVRVLQSKPFDW